MDPAALSRRRARAQRRLRHGVCLLSDIAWRDHPDYRAEQSFDRILRLPIGGIEHAERVFAAAAVAARYAGTLEPIAGEAVLRLIDEPRLSQALVLGLALRLAYSLSGATRSCCGKPACAWRAIA